MVNFAWNGSRTVEVGEGIAFLLSEGVDRFNGSQFGSRELGEASLGLDRLLIKHLRIVDSLLAAEGLATGGFGFG